MDGEPARQPPARRIELDPDLRSAARTFAWTFAVLMAIISAGPLDGDYAPSVVFYGAPIVIGLVASLLGRGIAGLLGVVIGVAGASLAAISTGMSTPPTFDELPERVPALVIVITLAAAGFLLGGAWRGNSERRRSASSPDH